MASKKELQAKLTPQQQKAAHLLVERQLSDDPDKVGLGYDEIAAEIGVHRQTLWRWRQNRIFIDYQNSIADDFFASYHTMFLRTVVSAAENHGSMKAVEMYAKLRGLLVTKEVIEVNEGSSRSEEDQKSELEELEKLLNQTDDFEGIE